MQHGVNILLVKPLYMYGETDVDPAEFLADVEARLGYIPFYRNASYSERHGNRLAICGWPLSKWETTAFDLACAGF